MWVLAVSCFALGCVRTPAYAAECRGERPQAQRVARKIHDEWPMRGEDQVSRLVRSVVDRLAGGDPRGFWKIAVVRNRSAEAYSIGDGRIYVSDGTVRVCESESELAAVLAHEMSHQILGHFCHPRPRDGDWWGRPPTRRSVGSISLQLDPDKEQAADRYALSLLQRAGYDPTAALRIARRVQHAMPRGHLDEMGRVTRLESLVHGRPVRAGHESHAFARVRAELLEERPIGR